MSTKLPANTESGLQENNNRNFQLRDLEHFVFEVDPTTGQAAIRTTSASASGESIGDTIYSDGVGTPDKGLLIMGSDGTNPQAVAVNPDGELKVALEAADIEIGAVEIKDHTTDVRVTVAEATTISASDPAQAVADANLKIDTEIMADWDNAASNGASVSGDVAHGDTDAGEPIKIGGIAKSAQQTAVTTGKRVSGVFNLFGELVLAGYTWATNSLRTEEIDPTSQHYSNLAINKDTTNVTAATHDYLTTMDGYTDFSLSGKLVDADGTLTMKVYMMNDEDTTSGDWQQVYGYNDDLDTTTNSWTVTNGTLKYAISFNNANYTNVKVELVASGSTNTVVIKGRRKF